MVLKSYIFIVIDLEKLKIVYIHPTRSRTWEWINPWFPTPLMLVSPLNQSILLISNCHTHQVDQKVNLRILRAVFLQVLLNFNSKDDQRKLYT